MHFYIFEKMGGGTCIIHFEDIFTHSHNSIHVRKI
jgi:hypothetical protein